MAFIEKMSIQGIRSFGPDDSDRGVLRFYSPLTLILGPNGSGKTTIIECLKYVTTGTLPAGGKLQSTFIHDPKIAHESTVKAQVKLKFNNTTKKVCVITRCMQATQQPKGVKMTTLDGTLETQRPDGSKQSISSRCSDLDREMVSLLGVGKPVLENVIFCHQEESTWPLSEGKTLKGKFDDIFASTRYVKALDMIIKTRKEMASSIKENQTEIKYLKQNKDKSQQIKADLTQAMMKYEASELSAKDVNERLAPIEAKLIKIEDSASDMRRLHTEIEKMKSERNEMERGMEELRGSIVNELPDETEELEMKLSQFSNEVKECEEKLKQHETENRRLEGGLNEISEKKSDLLLKIGKLEQEAQAHAENLQRRDKRIRHVAETYNFLGFSEELTDAPVERFNEKITGHRKQLEKEMKEHKENAEAKERELDSRILEINNRISSLNTEIRLKEEQMKENKGIIKEIRKKLSRVEGSSGRLSEIKRDLKNTKQERAEAEKNTNVEDLRRQIEELSALKNSLEPDVKKLESELNRMHQESTYRTQLDMHRKDKTSKDDKISKLLSKNEEALIELLGEVADDRVARQLDDFLFTLDKSIEKETKSLEKLRLELAGKKQEHSSLTEQLTRKKAKLRENKDRLASEIENNDYDDVRLEVENKLKMKNEDKGVLDGTSAMFTRYKSRLGKPNAQCPLCHRGFEEEGDIAELVDELEKKLRTLPQKLETVETELKELQERFNTVLSLEPVKRSIQSCEATDIPELEARIKAVTDKMEFLTKRIAENQNELKAKQAKSVSGNSMVPDLTIIDGYRRELRELNKKIAAQSAKISGGETDRTLQQVQIEKEDAQDRLDTARESYDRKQKKLMNYQEMIAQLDRTINELCKEQLDLERDLQEMKENETKVEELTLCNEVLFAEIDECKENILPLNEDLKKLKREQHEIVSEKETQMTKIRDTLVKLQERYRDVKTIQENINRYLSAGRDTALEECREKQTGLETKAEALDSKRSTVIMKIKKRQEDLQSQMMHERNLQDNLQLRRKKRNIVKRTEKIGIKEKELGGLDVNHLETEKQQLNREYHKLTKEKHVSEGRKQGIKDQLKTLKSDLDTDQFKDAEEKHRKMIVTLRTLEVASTDLEKYYRALDATIMNYHKTKINDINKIIRELWRNTYKGNDIETIEVQSDEDEGYVLGKRRNFNYRVVMVKGDVHMDMRGRCSAGQKVLASLIIRLALAETFCLNCGVLALDEPTTNLDRENIESLAFALVEIIKNRSKQKNFQLVIITHDEDFVELLGRADYVENYVRVSKNQFGCSRVKEANVSELHSE